jgi:putative nucleotidyltransferase with HDIG domain
MRCAQLLLADLRERFMRSARWLPVVLAGLVAATALVHLAGGPRTPLPHLYYFPIVLAAVLWGPIGGLIAGVTAGVLAGPLTLYDTAAGIHQATSAWLLRTAFFTGVGVVTGAYSFARARSLHDLTRLNAQTVEAFVRAIDARDYATARHSENVATYAVDLARAIGLDRATTEHVRWAALLHDVGKLSLPRAILAKRNALTEDEWRIVRRHPIASAHIVGGVDRFRPFLRAIRHHHERVDGTGYPDGLRGDEIPVEARVLAIADAFDAMTSERPYREALPENEALARLLEGAGNQFDAEMSAAFAALRTRRQALAAAA